MTSKEDTLHVIAKCIERSVQELIHTLSPHLLNLTSGRSVFGTLDVAISWSMVENLGLGSLEDLWGSVRDDVPRVYWRSPEDATSTFTAGALASVASSQPHALQVVREQIRAFEEQIQVIVTEDKSVAGASANSHPGGDDTERGHTEETSELKGLVRWYGGNAFQSEGRDATWADWPAAWFYIPNFEFTESNAGFNLKLNLIIDGETDLTQLARDCAQQFEHLFLSCDPVPEMESAAGAIGREHYVRAVGETVQDIRNGLYQKLVLAQRQKICAEEAFKVDKILRELRESYPTSFLFAISRGNSCFIGASPERLVAAHRGEVRIDTLAGTIARGHTLDEDEKLGQELLSSHKNRHEHQVVLEGILNAVSESTMDVDYEGTPMLKKLANVQHLHTPVRANLKDDAHLFDLVDALHPTPAVAGMPKETVLPFIRSREGMDRGWYAGAVGQVSMAGDGEFCVAIRSGLIQGHTAWLYAGAGIMEDSDPSSEWEETLLKLRPMQSAIESSTEPEGKPERGPMEA